MMLNCSDRRAYSTVAEANLELRNLNCIQEERWQQLEGCVGGHGHCDQGEISNIWSDLKKLQWKRSWTQLPGRRCREKGKLLVY